MNATSTHWQLSEFSGGTDILICRTVSIMSLSGRDNSGDPSRLKHDTSLLKFGSSAHGVLQIDLKQKILLFFIHF
jgi:hypothetical protein